jgi:D-tyrosyl-tRNA(Tyr) deacylase
MRALLQRVSSAVVQVDGEVVAEIGTGLLVFAAAARSDTPATARALAGKIGQLRILRGERALVDEPASATLVVSQFTLYADTSRGRRPSWGAAAPRERAQPLLEVLASELEGLGITVRVGVFGADMQVALVNDGPVTVLLDT